MKKRKSSQYVLRVVNGVVRLVPVEVAEDNPFRIPKPKPFFK